MVATTTILGLQTFVSSDTVDLVTHISTNVSQQLENLLTGVTAPAGSTTLAFGTVTADRGLKVTAALNAGGTTFRPADVNVTVTAAAAASRLLSVRQAGNVAFAVQAVAASATGIEVVPAAAGAGVGIAAVSTGAAENLSIDAKGTGTIALGGTSTGAITSTRLHNFSAAIGVTGAVTFSTNVISTTALATPAALGATQFTGFASTASGAVVMGFGTTGDVTLKNRAGTDVLYVGPNTTDVYLAAAVSRIIPGATSFSLRDNANANDNLLMTNAGAATCRNTVTVSTGGGRLRRGTWESAPPRMLAIPFWWRVAPPLV